MNTQPARPVVVGVDGGPGSAGALRYAVAEAVRQRAPLEVVHVMPRFGPVAFAPLSPLPPMLTTGHGLRSELESVAASILDQARETALDLAPTSEVRTVLEHGSRTEGLVHASDGAQLVVVGRESHHGVERVLSGATTAAVAARASCDVVVVPAHWTGDHRRGRVVVGIETHSHAHELLGPAFAAASGLGATLMLVTAWELPDPYFDRIEVRTHADEWVTEGTRVLTELLTDWRAVYPDVPVDIRIQHGRAASLLAEASRDSDLLVICRRRHPVHVHGHLGGVAYALLQTTDVPVLVVAPRAGDDTAPGLKLEDAGRLLT